MPSFSARRSNRILGSHNFRKSLSGTNLAISPVAFSMQFLTDEIAYRMSENDLLQSS